MALQLDTSVIMDSLPVLGHGLLFSLEITLTALIGGILLGILLALARLSKNRLLSRLAGAYVDTLRSIPLLMVILWCFFLLPILTGVQIGANKSAFITFTLFEAAFYCEIIRAGIQSISKGQLYASSALGLTYSQTMRHIILPQALRNMLPLLLTQTIVLFQDTSLVYAIGASDLLHTAEIAGKTYNRPVEMYLFAALLYFCICFSLSTLVKHLQKRIAIIR